jgi:hypothetical protein
MAPEELQELCLEARRRFYSWGSMAERLRDRQANAKSLLMLGVYLGLNLGTHFDIDRRQGLKLGAGKIATAEVPKASEDGTTVAELTGVPTTAGITLNSGNFSYES